MKKIVFLISLILLSSFVFAKQIELYSGESVIANEKTLLLKSVSSDNSILIDVDSSIEKIPQGDTKIINGLEVTNIKANFNPDIYSTTKTSATIDIVTMDELIKIENLENIGAFNPDTGTYISQRDEAGYPIYKDVTSQVVDLGNNWKEIKLNCNEEIKIEDNLYLVLTSAESKDNTFEGLQIAIEEKVYLPEIKKEYHYISIPKGETKAAYKNIQITAEDGAYIVEWENYQPSIKTEEKPNEDSNSGSGQAITKECWGLIKYSEEKHTWEKIKSFFKFKWTEDFIKKLRN